MENKRVSELPRIGEIADGAMFVVEQDGSAYHATAKQITDHTASANVVRPTAIDFNDASKTLTVTLEGGVTERMTWTEDASGNITSLKLSDGHTITVSGVS